MPAYKYTRGLENNPDDFSYNLVHEYSKLDLEQLKAIRDFFHEVLKLKETLEEIPDSEPTTEELEAEYKKSRLNSVLKTDSSALSTTGGIEKNTKDASNFEEAELDDVEVKANEDTID